MLDLAVKDFKAVLINMSKELKETMFKELKESVATISANIERKFLLTLFFLSTDHTLFVGMSHIFS